MEDSHLYIAVVDDHQADAEMLRMALQATKIPVEIVVFETGTQVLKYLNADEPDGETPCDLILIDLYLPGMSGFEVLERIRGVERLKSLPVVILSGSQNPKEIERCYALGANSYISKPAHLSEILDTAGHLMNDWFPALRKPRLSRL